MLSLPFENITTFVLSIFTVNFHFVQYCSNAFKDICKSSADSLIKTVSSAYNNKKSFINITISLSNCDELEDTPETSCPIRKSSRSF